VLRKLLRDVPAAIGLGLVLLTVLVAVFAPLLAPHPQDLTATHLLQRLRPPSWASPFGTDDLGRDLFSRVILGTRSALLVPLTVVALAIAAGVPLGLIAGWQQGWISACIMRLTDIFLSVPQLVLALTFTQLFGAGLRSAMLALAFTYWPFFTRIVYAETRRLKAGLFVDALRCFGASPARILGLHVLPNMLSPIIVRATIGMGFTILVAAMLGFLGMGASPPDPDWGLTIAQSRLYLPAAWWYSAFPGLAILLVVLGFNLLGDGLRDLADPRLRRSR
jgi:peptide/nickel transport system permease protein